MKGATLEPVGFSLQSMSAVRMAELVKYLRFRKRHICQNQMRIKFL